MGKRLNLLNGISAQQRVSLIDQWIFNEKYRNVAKRKLIDGITFEELACEYKISVNQAKNIVWDAINVIQEKYSNS